MSKFTELRNEVKTALNAVEKEGTGYQRLRAALMDAAQHNYVIAQPFNLSRKQDTSTKTLFYPLNPVFHLLLQRNRSGG